jgi:uncharacterized protein
MSHTERNKAIVQEFLTALAAVDVERVSRVLSPDAEIWLAGNLPHSGTKSGASVMAGLPGMRNAFDGPLTIVAKAFTAEGDRVAVEGEGYGTTVMGHKYHNRYHYVFVVRDEKIVVMKEYMDTAHAAEAFPPPHTFVELCKRGRF